MTKDRRWVEVLPDGNRVIHAVARRLYGPDWASSTRQSCVACSGKMLDWTRGPDVGDVNCLVCLALKTSRAR